MDTTIIKPRQTFIRLDRDGWAYIVRYWRPLDAALCELSGRCQSCTARGSNSDPLKSLCFARVLPSRLQAECFKFDN
jgi:hypothetical protein